LIDIVGVNRIHSLNCASIALAVATLFITHPLLLPPPTLEPLHSHFGDGSTASGEKYTDVTVAGLTATSLLWEYSAGFQLSNFPPEGLMGMRFQSISVYNATPVFQIVAEGQRHSPVFAMKLVASGLELTLGGLNSSLYTGDMAYIPVSKEGYWQTTFDALNLGGQIVNTTPCIIDSVRIHN
jgi:hypothetical protein